MHRILKRETLAPAVNRYVIEAPKIAQKRKAGQFVLIRICPEGERIPLTIADADEQQGTITLVVQEVGKTTAQLAGMQEGDALLDVVGPLGTPTHIQQVGTVVCVGGGIGIAPLYPIAQAARRAGNQVITILGARNHELLIMQEEMQAISSEMIICTDDGSCGRKGFVSDMLRELIEQGRKIDQVITIGPAIMMKVVCDVTRPHAISTLVSLNAVMVDGTGMCGGCRVEVGGESKFCCVDGPEFDGHQVDFDLLMRRQRMYRQHEEQSLQQFKQAQDHRCRLEDAQ